MTCSKIIIKNTINLYDKNTSTTSRANTTTNSSGYWNIAHTTAGEFDIQITSGSSKRRIKFDDKIHLSEVDTEVLNVRGNNGAAAPLYFFSDQGDDAGDRWLFNAAAGGVFTMGNDLNSQGTYVAHVTITPNSTVANSTVAVAGNLTVNGSTLITATTVTNPALYLRKTFVKKANYITIPSTASFSAVTASAPSGLTATNEQDFVFFINGQYMNTML